MTLPDERYRAVKMAEQVEREKQLAAVRQERMQLAQRQQSEQQQRLQAHLSQEAERLRAAIPEMADEVKGEVVRKEIKDFARSIGFSEQELSQVYDHRAVLTLYKAMQYDKLQSAKPNITKKVSEAPKVIKAGVSQPRDSNSDELRKLKARAKQSGRVADAAKAFEKFL